MPLCRDLVPRALGMGEEPLPVPIPCPALFAPILQAGKLRHVMTCAPWVPPGHVTVSTAPCPSTTPKVFVLAELHLRGVDTEHRTVFPQVG